MKELSMVREIILIRHQKIYFKNKENNKWKFKMKIININKKTLKIINPYLQVLIEMVILHLI